MATNPLGVIDRYYTDLNATDRLVADYIKANATDASRFPIDRIASEVGVSKSTLVRFSQKIGYSGFAQLKHDLASFLLSHHGGSSADAEARSATRIASTYARYLTTLADSVPDKDLDTLASLIRLSDRILIAGYDRGFHAASQLNKRLMNVGVLSQPTNELGSLHNSFDLYGAKDLLIVMTVADTTRSFVTVVPAIAESGIKIACVTCAQTLPFKRLCDSYIVLPRISRDPDLAFLDDQAVFFVFIEILIDAIAKHMATGGEA